ncbi:MAG: hypothetical protein ACFFCS_17935 [Candidatus Hodarchaeota archaeon]
MAGEDDDEELAALRRKRMAALMAKQKQAELNKELEENAQFFLEKKIAGAIGHLFAPDAYEYFEQIKTNNPALHEQIMAQLFPPVVILNIDILLAKIRAGRVPRGLITLMDIQLIERKLMGVKSTIQYKKRGEEDRLDLSSLFKGD